MPPQSWIFELEISKILTEKRFPNRSLLNYFQIVSVQFLVKTTLVLTFYQNGGGV